MFSGRKPKIKKRITRPIASVISWFIVGNLKAEAMIKTSQKILIRRQKKNAIQQVICRRIALYGVNKNIYLISSAYLLFVNNFFFLRFL